MHECISIENALEVIRYKVCQGEGNKEHICKRGSCAYCGIIEIMSDISNIPPANVQPVVRCKDCKHRKERHYEESGEKPYIKYECKFTKYSMSDDGFCSFGARLEDGDTNK